MYLNVAWSALLQNLRKSKLKHCFVINKKKCIFVLSRLTNSFLAINAVSHD